MRPLSPDADSPGTAIGIDVGGTKIAGGLVDLASGAVSLRHQAATGTDRGGAAVLADVVAMARAIRDAARAAGQGPVALGVGLPELVDHEGAPFSGYLVDWRDLPARWALAQVLPARLSSDVRAAALAEARFGAGRGIGDFYFVTIGTGVSGVLVQGGVPYAGSRGAALVIGNGPTRQRCPACGAETVTIMEDVSGGAGLARAFGTERAEEVIAAALAGDAQAGALIARAAQPLGQVLALLAGALDPAAIVLGGGLGSAPGPYHEALEAEFRAGLWADDPRPLPLLRAALGPDAGLIGAALAAAFTEELGNQPKAASTRRHQPREREKT